MKKTFELTLTVKVVLDDPEATEQTVRFLLEEDLRDKGWDADVEMIKNTISGGNHMKISKDECDKEFAERKLIMSDEKCKQCEYLYLCPYMSQAMDEVVNGD